MPKFKVKQPVKELPTVENTIVDPENKEFAVLGDDYVYNITVYPGYSVITLNPPIATHISNPYGNPNLHYSVPLLSKFKTNRFIIPNTKLVSVFHLGEISTPFMKEHVVYMNVNRFSASILICRNNVEWRYYHVYLHNYEDSRLQDYLAHYPDTIKLDEQGNGYIPLYIPYMYFYYNYQISGDRLNIAAMHVFISYDAPDVKTVVYPPKVGNVDNTGKICMGNTIGSSATIDIANIVDSILTATTIYSNVFLASMHNNDYMSSSHLVDIVIPSSKHFSSREEFIRAPIISLNKCQTIGDIIYGKR